MVEAEKTAPSVEEKEPAAQEIRCPEVIDSELCIGQEWHLWEQFEVFSTAQSRVHHTNSGNYGNNMKKVACFNDLVSFAQAWKNMPHAHMAKLFYDHETGSVPFWKRGEDSEIRINALSLFMANVKPEWEDEVNKQGGHLLAKVLLLVELIIRLLLLI